MTSSAVAALVAVISVVVAPAAPAAGPPPSEQAYSQAKTAAEDHSNWLSFVNGGTPIWQLSIPGTHDSYTAALASHGWDYQTQTLPVPEQLKMGIRALDLRLQANNQNDFDVEHGGASAKITLSGVLSQLRDFLSGHPAEFVILRAKVDKEGSNFTENFNSILGKYQDILWRGNADATFQNPALDQVRGKVILLKDFPSTSPTINSYGMKWGAPGFVIQDKYNFVSNWDLYPKWEQVVSNWNHAEAGTDGYVNFLSGSGASFPYFVASGRSSPTGPLLSTGRVVTTGSLNNPASGPYPDFHRVSCALGLCTVAFTGTNLLMYDVLSAQNRAGANHAALRGRQGMGLIYIDFPGQPLVNSIIARNPGAGPTGPIESVSSRGKCADVNSGIFFDGNKVQLYDCNGTLAQRWSVSPDGTIRSGIIGCLDITGGVYTDGTPIIWYKCTGGANQQWRAVNGQLVNPASGKCLDNPRFSTTNGTQLILWSCNGGSNQQWRLPGSMGAVPPTPTPTPTVPVTPSPSPAPTTPVPPRVPVTG